MFNTSVSGFLSGAIALSLAIAIIRAYQPGNNGGPINSQPTGTRLFHRASGR